MTYSKLLVLFLSVFPLNAIYAQNTSDYKLILFIDDELILRGKVSNFKIKYLEKEIDVQYDLASIKYQISDLDKKVFFESGKVECTFNYLDHKRQDLLSFNIKLDAWELDAGYLIIRIYNRTKENQRKFRFGSNAFLYEYESAIGYHLLPRRKGRK